MLACRQKQLLERAEQREARLVTIYDRMLESFSVALHKKSLIKWLQGAILSAYRARMLHVCVFVVCIPACATLLWPAYYTLIASQSLVLFHSMGMDFNCPWECCGLAQVSRQGAKVLSHGSYAHSRCTVAGTQTSVANAAVHAFHPIEKGACCGASTI